MNFIRIEVTWVEFIGVEFSWIEFTWVEFSCVQLSRVEFNWIEFGFVHLSSLECTWVHLSWVDFNWVRFISMLDTNITQYRSPDRLCVYFLYQTASTNHALLNGNTRICRRPQNWGQIHPTFFRETLIGVALGYSLNMKRERWMELATFTT